MAQPVDLEALIADAERAVVAADAQFVRASGELASAVRGRAGRTVKAAAIGGATLIGALLVYRLAAAKPKHVPAAARPARSAGFIGHLLGSLLRSSGVARPASWLPLLVAPVLAMLRQRRLGTPPFDIDRPSRRPPRG